MERAYRRPCYCNSIGLSSLSIGTRGVCPFVATDRRSTFITAHSPITSSSIFHFHVLTMFGQIVLELWRHWPTAILLVFITYLAKNRFRHGLHKYPGPLLASLTDWWRFFDVLGRRPDITQRALHKKHGNIIRYGPNALSFADPQALKTIYGLNKGFVKVGQSVILTAEFHINDNIQSPTFIQSSKQCPKASGSPHSSQRPTSNTTPSYVAV